MPDAPPRRSRPLAYVTAVAVGGFVVGAVAAALSDSPEAVFLTDTVSYVPSEAWWMHGLVYGATLALLALGIWGARRLVAFLLARGLLTLAVGVLLGGMGAAMIALALGADALDDGQRTMFGWILGPMLLAFGAAMVWAARAPRRTPRAKR